MAAPHERAPAASSSRGCATPATARVLLSRRPRRARGARCRGHGVGARVLRVAAKPSRRALAIASSPHFRGYTVLGDERTKGVSDWREQLDVGPEEPAAVVTRGDPPWRRLRGPNQWPARLPAMQPTVLAWMRAMDRVGLAVLRALALGLGPTARSLRRRRAAARRSAPEDHSLPRAAARRRHGPRRRHAPRLGPRLVRAARRRRRLAGRARRRARRRDAEARHLRHESRRDAASRDAAATCARRSIACRARRRAASGCRSPTSFIRGSTPCSRRSRCRPSSRPQTRGGQNPDPNDPIFATFGDNYLKIRLRSHRDVALAHYGDLERA